MAKNTYKKATNKQKPKGSKVNLPSISIFRDPRLKLAFGLSTLGVSVFLFFSFLSFLFNGEQDQIVNETLGQNNIIDSGKESANWLGVLGGYISNKFIHDWFGISSFLFVPILGITGYQIVYKKTVKFFPRLIRMSSFLLFWISITIG